MTSCTIRNGTYSCQRPEGHAGKHRSVFLDAGSPRTVFFDDAYSDVTVRKPSWAAPSSDSGSGAS